MPSPKIQSTIERLAQFVNMQQDIRTAFVVGSQARAVAPADEWSDVDIVLVTTQPNRYLGSPSWLKETGLKALISFVEGTAVSHEMERRVLFDNGVDVDFSVFPLTSFTMLNSDYLPEEILAVTRRGIQVIKDNENIIPLSLKNPAAKKKSRVQISPEDFDQAVNDFLYHFVWTARKLRRGELWVAKSCCDGYMKRLLLEMIEWYMLEKKGGYYDTWHEGRFIEKWADKFIIDSLYSAFAHYDYSDIEAALYSTLELYTQLAKELAAGQRFPYPSEGDRFARELAGKVLAK